MSGREKVTDKQERAIVALLAEPTMAAGAAKAGVSQTTAAAASSAAIRRIRSGLPGGAAANAG